MRRILFLGFTWLIAEAAAASSAGPVTLSFITYQKDGTALVYVLTSQLTGTKPSCATFGSSGNYSRFAIDTSTAGGKSQLAGAIAAHTSGEQVWLSGTGTCDIVGDTESIQQFHTAT
jgi:hypothetical protein